MKKLFFLVTTITLCFTTAQLNAASTTKTQALNAANGWLKLNCRPFDTSANLQTDNVNTYTGNDGQPIYYIVNLTPQGFIAVSADDMVEPIIAFAPEGTYDPSLKNPLAALITQDLQSRTDAVKQSIATTASTQPQDTLQQQSIFEASKLKAQTKWDNLQTLAETTDDTNSPMELTSLTSVSDVRVSPLIQSKWNQGSECGYYCYNYYTPNHYTCGCVATAFAQLMKYHQHPTTGIGVHAYSILVNGVPRTLYTRGGNGAGGAYNWSDMTLDPQCSNYSDTNWKAIGALCYDAGITIDIAYGNPSGADPYDVKVALLDIFNYSNAIHGYNNGNNIGSGLNAMINPNLDASLPVMIGINGTSDGGHAILADGYGYSSSTLYHHLNMGWGGSSDAWYNLPAVYTTNYTATSVFKCIYNIFTYGTGEIISGRVTDQSGNPLENVLVSAIGTSGAYFDVTDNKGIYALTRLPSNSTYTVTATKTGCQFEPLTLTTATSRDNYNTSGNIWKANFGYGPKTIFVDKNATGINNGSSWLNAYNHLQDALSVATQDDQIYVAQGTYKPDQGNSVTQGDRYASFELKNNVAIYGGFPTTGCQFENRDPQTYPTTLSADLNSNDGPNFTNNSENSYHILTSINNDETAILDGFTITAANANGTSTDITYLGGGIYNSSSTPTIKNCSFISNLAGRGSAIHNQSASPIITNCIFKYNKATSSGCICNLSGSSPKLTNCHFIENTSNSGGVMESNSSYDKPIITNCLFAKNSASYGGAMVFRGTVEPQITNCTFYGNHATYYGGVLWAPWDQVKPEFISCILWNNYDKLGYSESSQFYNAVPIFNYSCIQNWTGTFVGQGNISSDPQFTDVTNNDYHLKSQIGRWNPNSLQWITDTTTSPCIDTGDPAGNWTKKLWPHGTRVNMGAYGATSQASMSPSTPGNTADLNTDGSVDNYDLQLFSNKWLCTKKLLPEDLNRNGSVNIADFSTFANQWLWQGQGWQDPMHTWQGTTISLWDVFGRKVYISDYAGSPTLLYTGPCWCGGCQKESNYMEDFANEYIPKGLHVIRGVCGDNELSALDFKNHYKLPIVHLMDTNRVLDSLHNPVGWPFFAIFDKEGNLVYKAVESYVHEELDTIEPIINNLLKNSPLVETIEIDNLQYPSPTIARSGEQTSTLLRERFSSIARDYSGKIYVVFTSNRNGNSDVFIKFFNGANWSQDIAIAQTSAEEYDPSITVDTSNNIWVSWTSNYNADHYNIFVTKFNSFTFPTPLMSTQLTQSEDGAMHSRMAADITGNLWITYYKWGFNQGYSRDKEVYLRKFDGSQWSSEIRLTPTDVPGYEDHSDPTITPFASGVAVSWCWDFHEPDGYLADYTKPGPYPTIFARTIDNTMNLGPIIDISGDSGERDIDLTPAIAVAKNNQIWCLWDSKSNSSYLKTLKIKNIATDTFYDLTGPVKNVCTPSIVVNTAGTLTVIWSQTTDGNNWTLKLSTYNPSQNSFSTPETLISENYPRFPAAVYDLTGQLWISCSVKTDQGREIITITP